MRGFWNDKDGLNLPETLGVTTVVASMFFYFHTGEINPNWTNIVMACLGVGGLQRVGVAKYNRKEDQDGPI